MIQQNPIPDRHEQDLSQLLHTLGSAQPGEDFARRTLRGVKARQSAGAAKSSPRINLWPRFAIAGACTAALALAVVATHHGKPKYETHIVASAARPKQLLPKPGQATPIPDASQPRTLATLTLPAPRLMQVTAQANPDAQDPAYAPSMVAPPLPLTEQERLLIRATRREAPTELAMLNPDELAKREADDAAQFNQFFPPPPAQPATPDPKSPAAPAPPNGESR